MSTITRPTAGEVEQRDRPAAGDLEQRAAPTAVPTVDGRRLRGLIPYGVESRDLGGWREVMEPGSLAGARMDDLVATVDHGGVPIGRHPGTLRLEQRGDGLGWSVELPESRSDVREAVERGDLCAGSWRMVVGRDEWRGDVRHIHEVTELRDVSVVSSPAYHASVVEHRSTGPSQPPAGPTPGPEPRRGGLRVEDRTVDAPTVEARALEALRTVRRGEARSLTVASDGAIAPPELSTYLFDRLRPSSVMLQSGVTVIATDRESVQWPQLTADMAPGWYAELDEIVASDPTFATLEANPKKLAARVEMSNEVIDDSDPSILNVLQGHVATILSLKLDLAVLEGNQGVDPKTIKGLKYVAGIGAISMGTNGAALTDYDPFVEAVGMLRAANVPGPYAIVAHPRTATALALLKRETGSSEQLTLPAGMPEIHATSQLSVTEAKGTAVNASSAYVFAPSQLVIVRRQDASIELDRSRLFNIDASELRGKLRADLLVPNPAAVVRVDGIIPA